jgi:DNA-3-methyladenine glycosylase I
MSALFVGPDGRARCRWAGQAPDFLSYHDTEWGFPTADDCRLFEKICLEGFQSGLSWRTILGKRDGFRAAFAGFDFRTIARFTARDIDWLVQDPSIVRHRGKIESVVNNAQQACKIVDAEGSLAAFLWRFEPGPKDLAPPQSASTSAASVALSKELKTRGWTFVGPTTVYAFMQAVGLINDHAPGCVIRPEAEKVRQIFRRPVSADGLPPGKRSATKQSV